MRFIGVVETAGERKAKVRIYQKFCSGLKEIEAFSHIIILYWFSLRDKEDERSTLQVIPKRHTTAVQVGVFACRSPSRPNPVGLCVAELTKIEKCTLHVKGLDALKGSPIIDVKPYIPKADSVPDAEVPEWTSHGPST